ncbi:uncharacterized protein [Panulirus ornatus]
MPVPFSPYKKESSQSLDVATPETEVHPVHETVHGPSSPLRSNEVKEEIADPDVVAGYQDCLKETLRFLLEEEHLPADHPVVMGLAAHLTREHAHVELTKISQQLASAIVTAQIIPSNMQVEEMYSSIHADAFRIPRTLNAGFEVTLIEDDNEDDEILVLDDDETTTKEECEYVNVEEFNDSEEAKAHEVGELEVNKVTETLMAEPELRQQLIRFVYQGCDLFATPHPISQTSCHGLVLQL